MSVGKNQRAASCRPSDRSRRKGQRIKPRGPTISKATSQGSDDAEVDGIEILPVFDS